MGASELEKLRSLVDSSLRSPEYGIVNFHHLHKVLHGILTHLGLKYDGKDLASEVKDYANSNGISKGSGPDETERAKEDDDHVEARKNDYNSEKVAQEVSERKPWKSNFEDPVEDEEVKKLKSQQKELESKLSNLEDKLKLLDDFPSNKTIIQEAQQAGSKDGIVDHKDSTLSGIWQFMKVNRRLQAAEDAIDRIMSILNEFLGSGQGKNLSEISNNLQDLSTELQQLKDQLKDQLKESTSKDNKDDSLIDDSTKNDKLDKLLDSLATKNELKEYVKWPALEEALQIKKDKNKRKIDGDVNIISFDGEKQQTKGVSEGRPRSSPAPPTQSPVALPEVPKTAMVTEATQVTSKDLNDDVKDLNDDDKDLNNDVKYINDDVKEERDSPHPSPEVVECLRRIGELNDEHNKMNEVIANKMDKFDLEIPPDLQNQLDQLKKDLDYLTQNGSPSNAGSQEIKNATLDNREKIDAIRRELAAMSRQAKQAYIERPQVAPAIDNDALNAIQRKLTELENNQDSSTGNTEKRISELLENLKSKQDHIEALYKHIQNLQDIKADKDNVAIEMDYKADKASLENKVNTSTFDSTFTMLDEGLREALQKMDDYMNEELALKNALKQLSCDMKEKMDTDAFKAMQNYLEKRIADVQKSRTMIAREANVDLTGAAGLRRPLPIDFHCISCNRPVEVKYNRNVEPSLPKADSIHIKRSKGPYVSYEIDQLRNYHRGQQPLYRPDKVTSDGASLSRPCGGSHTVMNQRKPVRIHTSQMNHVMNGSSREEAPTSHPNWTREVSIIDFVKGTDGHVYKGRYKTIPPISRRHKHTPSESDLPPLTKDPCPPLTGHKWSSEPELSRARDEGEKMYEEKSGKHTCITPPTTSKVSPNSRFKRILSQRASDVEPNPIPSPSPPTARENEHQHRINREEFLMRQQQELAQENLFSPRHQTNDGKSEEGVNKDVRDKGPSQRMYSPHSTKRTRSSGANITSVVGLHLSNRRVSADSIDDVMS